MKRLVQGWTLPVVLLVFACVAFLRVSVYHPALLTGNDLFWHLEYGNYILEHGALPTVDWLTWTSAGQPYQITQWLGEVLLALPVKLGGPLLLSITLTAAACLTLFFAWRTAALYVHNPVIALYVALFTIFPVLTLNARPQVFGLTCFSALVWVLAVWLERRERWALWAMSAVMVCWVNLHGSYIIGVVYIAALGGGAWLGTLAEMKGKFFASVHAHLPLAIASFTAIFAVLINPYGWHAFEYVLQISQLETTKSGVISEWAATSLTTGHGQAFFIIFFVALLSMSLAKQRPTLQSMLGFLGTVYFGLQADRQSLIALLALVPYFAQSLQSSWMESELERKLAIYVPLWKGVMVLTIGGGLGYAMHSMSAQHIENNFERMYPVKLMRYLDEKKIDGKIFNKVEYGGYIESLGKKAFIDGRLDLFKDEMALGSFNALNGKAGWQAFLDKYKPDLYILDNEDVLVESLLKTNKCNYIYLDKYHSALQCS